MRRTWRWCVAAACACMVAPGAPLVHTAATRPPAIHAVAPCRPAIRTTLRLPGRVDSLLPVPADGATVALAAATPSGVPFLPHDDLLVLARAGRVRVRITLPPYEIPPGLAVAPGGRNGLVRIVDDADLLTLDVGRGRLVAHYSLGLQALGWPAAIAAGPRGRLYVAGQPPAGRAAVLEALAVSTRGRPRVVWRAPLGLTHAGIWLNLAGHGLVAAYLPDADDVHGTVALFDARTGVLRSSYAVPVSPAAADPQRDRLYLDLDGTIHALTLREGAAVASTAGVGPLAPSPSRDLVAFVRGDSVVLAAAGTLRPLARVPVGAALSLAFTPDGSRLLVGRRTGVARIDVGRCGEG